ncbi:2',3'-cyclic-nucleotide 2'-phosphodiesterase / 3'-nucleotidase [Lachnospiraceae bacterium XBB1006]|nr:2',3'-cyclic-nucleotide 2'-phosphodiesterase / 3'-nucleotidase [Lachnospiraceae bacterium XBB1006]
MNKFGRKFLAFTMVAAMVIPSFGTAMTVKAAEGETKTIQILQTSDLHGKFVPFKYATYTEDNSGSLAQLATIIKERRNDNTVLVDGGDSVQDNSAQLFLEDKTHPILKGLNLLNYDYWTFGNHEFNFGMSTLAKIKKQFKGTVLGGNVYDKDGKTRFGKLYDIVEKDGVKIAIIGVVTPNITRWDATNLKGYKVTSPIDEVKAAIAEVKGKVDLIVVSAHMDEKNEYEVAGSGVEDLVKACPEIDVCLAAHGHQVLNKTIGNTLVTENQNMGQTLTDIDITLKKNAEGKYEVVSKEAETVSAKGVEADKEMCDALASYDKRAKEDALSEIGQLCGGDLAPVNEIPGITQAQLQETAMINLINKVQMHYTGAEIGAAALFDVNSNIKEGKILKKDASLIYKYDNTLYKLKITGKQLKQYMEWSASYYNTVKENDLTVSYDENIRAYLYDMFSGVNYEINLSKEVGNRIENLTLANGKPVKDNASYILAVNNYRANSQLLSYGDVYKKENGDTLPKLLELDVTPDGSTTAVRDLIVKYINDELHGKVYPEYNNNWKITGINWDEAEHDKVVALAAAGLIKVPTSQDGRTPNVKSVTKEDLAAFANVKTSRIKFNGNGGMTNGQSICYVDGKKFGEKATTFRAGYKFNGWYTEAKGGKLLSDEELEALTDSQTVYAHWTKVNVKNVKVSLVKATKKSLSVKISNAKSAEKFVVSYSLDKNFKKGVKKVTVKTANATLKNLKAGKTYYVKVKAIAKDSLGKAVSKTSKVVKMKTK